MALTPHSPALRRTPRQEPYTGPPSYPAPPKWGFPNLVWRLPTRVPGTATTKQDPAEAQRTIGIGAIVALLALAAFTTLAACAELWRYALLVRSRDAALSAGIVQASDTLVVWLYLATVPLLSLVAVILTFAWLLLARAAAAHRSGYDPPRSLLGVILRVFAPWPAVGLVLGLLWLVATVVPAVERVAVTLMPVAALGVLVVCLVLTGPVVVELEHAALGNGHSKPRPSRLALAWWAAWVCNGVLVALTAIWRTRDGLQQQADAVALTAVTNIAAAVLAVLTVLVIRRVMALLAPRSRRPPRRFRVVDVRGAPEPELRTTRPASARR
ncbi:DUF4328 domain-containing protein [Haloechinothrix salitolerans]|uniref:DUF4328 domain-containing protein n=1 Tax=Haloechinothrix salitolerans TaxID=926830 RepID=A0ABW2BSP4_9PSEU